MAAARSLSAGRSSFDGRQRRARERAELVADDRRGRRQERPRLRAATGRAPARRAAGPRASARARWPCGRSWRASSASRRARRQLLPASRAGWRPGSRASRTRRSSSRTNSASCVSLAPSSSISSEKLWTTRLMFRRRSGELLVDPARVARGRLEAADRLRELAAVVRRARSTPSPSSSAQVVARVGVERGEDLVEVDVGQRLRDRDPLALGQLAGLLGAGVQLGDHVLQAGLRAQQDRRVAVDPSRARARSSCRRSPCRPRA